MDNDAQNKEHTPTAAQFGRLIDYLRKNLAPDTRFYMQNCCACVAGRIGAIGTTDCERNARGVFGPGMMTVAKLLGFEHHQYLEAWAKANPDIWGNIYGEGMFGSEPCAWTGALVPTDVFMLDEYSNKRIKAYTVSLAQVIAHLEGVRSRLAERERQIPPPDFSYLLEDERQPEAVS